MARYQNYHHWSKTPQVIAYIVNRRPYWVPSLISAYVFIVFPNKWVYWIPCPKKHMVRHQNYHNWWKAHEVLASIRNWQPSWTPSWISADVLLVLPHKRIFWIPCPQKHMVRHQNYQHWWKTQEVIASIRNWQPSWTPSWIWPLSRGQKIWHRPYLDSSWKIGQESIVISIWT